MKDIRQLFEIMLQNKMVRITKEARQSVNVDNLGTWFYIQSINCDNTVNLCSNTDFILENEPITSIS